MGSRADTTHPRQVLWYQPRGESLSPASASSALHVWPAGSGANPALIAPLGTTGSQTLSDFNAMNPRAQNRLFSASKGGSYFTTEGKRSEWVLSGLDPLYTKQRVSGEKGVSHPSYLFTSLTTADTFSDSSGRCR